MGDDDDDDEGFGKGKKCRFSNLCRSSFFLFLPSSVNYEAQPKAIPHQPRPARLRPSAGLPPRATPPGRQQWWRTGRRHAQFLSNKDDVDLHLHRLQPPPRVFSPPGMARVALPAVDLADRPLLDAGAASAGRFLQKGL